MEELERLLKCVNGSRHEGSSITTSSHDRNPRQRLDQLEARLRRFTSADTGSCSHEGLSASPHSDVSLGEDSTGSLTPTASTKTPQSQWESINSELLNHGLPTVLEPHFGFSPLRIRPSDCALHAALQSCLRELSTLKRSLAGLSTAAEDANQREASALRQLRREVHARESQETELKAAADKARAAAEVADSLRAAAERSAASAAAEAKELRAAVDRLHRQLQKQVRVSSLLNLVCMSFQVLDFIY